MVYASEFSADLQGRRGLRLVEVGSEVRLGARSCAAKDIEIARLSGIYVTNLQNAGADLAHARAELQDAHTIALADRDKHVLGRQGADRHRRAADAAADSRASSSPSPPTRRSTCRQLPKRILIVGGGYIARGVRRHLQRPRRRDHADVPRRQHPARLRQRRARPPEPARWSGAASRSSSAASTPSSRRPTAGIKSTLTNGHDLETDVVMYATGREPYTEGLGLETAGVKLNERGAVVVDAYSKTNVDNIWAVGDVTDRINLTPVAIREGAAFAETEFYGRPTTLRPRDGGQRGLLAAAGRRGGPDRGRRAPPVRQGRHLPRGVPADEGDLLRRRGADADEAGRRPGRPTGCSAATSSAPTRRR